jgi:hypothetical protein
MNRASWVESCRASIRIGGIALVAAACSARAALAQRLVGGALECGDERPFLVRSESPTSTAAQLRIAELEQLTAMIGSASVACARAVDPASSCAKRGVPACLPGCQPLHDIAARRATIGPSAWAVASIDPASQGIELDPTTLTLRRQALSLDARLEEAATVVLGHAHCRRMANQNDAPAECARLLAIESPARIHAGEARANALGRGRDTGAAFELLAFYLGEEASSERPAIPLEAYDAAVAVAAAPWARRGLDLAEGGDPADRTPPFAPASWPPSTSAEAALAAELAHARASEASCQTADLHLGAQGELEVRSPSGVVRSVCFDAAGFARESPFSYAIRAGSGGGEGVAWPSEKTKLARAVTSSEAATLRVFARARPASVLALARDLQVQADNERPLDAQQRDLSARRERRRAIELRRLALDALGEHVARCTTRGANEVGELDRRLKRVLVAPKLGDAELHVVAAAVAELGATLARELEQWELGSPGCGSPASPLPLAARRAARAAAEAALPEPPLGDIVSLQASLEHLTAYGAALRERAATLVAEDETQLDDARRAIDAKLASLCEVAARPLLIVQHDLGAARGEQSIEYDLASGFTSTGAPGGELSEEHPLAVRVTSVPPRASVRIELDGEPVPSLQPRPDQQPTAALLERQLGLPGTQRVALPFLRGGRRYELQVCTAPGAPAQDCASPSSRIIGRHSVPVHGRSYFGVRAGLAGGATFGAPRRSALKQSGDDSVGLWRVEGRAPALEVLLPIMATWYPWGRDPLATSNLEVSLGAGIDVTSPLRHLIPLGIGASLGGVGITAGVWLDRTERPNIAEGTYLLAPGAERPDLHRLYGSNTEWGVGGFVMLGIELDRVRVLASDWLDPAPAVARETHER